MSSSIARPDRTALGLLPPDVKGCITDTFPSTPFLHLLIRLYEPPSEPSKPKKVLTFSRYTLVGALQLKSQIAAASTLITSTVDTEKIAASARLRQARNDNPPPLTRSIHFVSDHTIAGLDPKNRALQLAHFIDLNRNSEDTRVCFAPISYTAPEANLIAGSDGIYVEAYGVSTDEAGVVTAVQGKGEHFLTHGHPQYEHCRLFLADLALFGDGGLALSPEASNDVFASWETLDQANP